MWIKVCGIRDSETAVRVADAGADAIGLNFYQSSPRSVDVATAAEISNSLPDAVSRVGVFVNHSLDEVEWISSRCRLDLLQLHGDEPATFLIELQRRLPHLRLIRAWRMREDGLGGLSDFLDECSQSGCELAGCLVDAHVEGVYGGSGKRVPWEKLARDYDQIAWPPLILAGGLKSSNVFDAIAATRPWGVDVASGVESTPGVKEMDFVAQFVEEARKCQSSPGTFHDIG